ncbi:MAG TPA: hypothetical protein VK155_13075, partial [Bacteroidales bacterium]|nr:hypothetical protein [Bacteroidales bacterium]
NGEGYCEDEESCGSTFVVEDVEDFTMPADDGEIIACADDLYTPTPPAVNDYCGDAITPTGPVVSQTPACEGIVTYVWNYADCEGNNHNWTYTFTIEYEDFTMPADDGEIIACASELYTPTPPTVYDNCNELITPSGPVVSGTPECEGNVTYVWNYADCEGNNHNWTYTFTIEYEDFDMPADDGETIACASEAYQPVPPTVYDNCGNLITPTGPVLGGTYVVCDGTITYTWTYCDCEGNTHDWVYTFTVVDEIPPTITCPTSFAQWCPDVVLTEPEYSDNCTDVEDIIFTVTLDGTLIEDPVFPLYFNDLLPGIHTVVYSATDLCDNEETCEFTIDITYDCAEDVDYVVNNGNPVFCQMVNNTLTATINVPYASVSWSLAPGSDWVITSPVNTTTITFNAMSDDAATFILVITDANGCEVSCEYTIVCTPASENCTLTMGGWGQPGGSYCSGLSQHDRLVELLTPTGITVGRDGHSYYSTDGEGGAECIEEVLPSGGKQAALNKDYICYENNNNLRKNTLLGQCLTLAINIRNSDPGLAGLPFNQPFL